MDELVKALPPMTAAMVLVIAALWKRLIDKDKEIKELTKELVSTARGLDILRAKHERERALSSNPPPSS